MASTSFQALSSAHLVGIRELSQADLERIFQAAVEFKAVLNRPIRKVPSLRELTVANLFFESSTRTKLSFELAEKRLSADVLNFSAASSSVNKGETLLDTARNILAMKVDMLVIRHPHPGAAHYLRRHTDSVIINAGDGTHEHPTQALLDCFSLREHFGELRGLRVALVGDILHSRVALSNIFALQKLGAEVWVCGPPTLLPRHIASLGVHVSYDLAETLRHVDAVNMLRIQQERMQAAYFPTLREYSMRYGLTADRLAALTNWPVILHPGPMNRGVEITSEAADSPAAIILEQVENGVAVRMAVLYLLAQTISSTAAPATA